MKRGWIGLGLLVVMLVTGLLVTWRMGRSHGEMAADLDRAAGFALTENWEKATVYAQKAKNDWEKGWHFSAAFADHGPMENIDSLLAQLQTYAAARDGVSFAAICAQLSRQIDAVGEAHGLTWWNLL